MAAVQLTRLFRADCREIPPKEAEQHLSAHEDIVRSVARRLRRNSAWYAAGYDMEDVFVVGRMAVLEAVQTYQETSAASLRTWVAQVVRWRMIYLITSAEETGRTEQPRDSVPPHIEPHDVAFEDRMLCRAQLTEVADAYSRMDPRAQLVLTQLLSNGSHREVSASLGISARRSEHVLAQTRRYLRDQLLDDEVGPGVS